DSILDQRSRKAENFPGSLAFLVQRLEKGGFGLLVDLWRKQLRQHRFDFARNEIEPAAQSFDGEFHARCAAKSLKREPLKRADDSRCNESRFNASHLIPPAAIHLWRNFRRFDLAAAAPENVRVRNRNRGRLEMPIYRCFVVEQ